MDSIDLKMLDILQRAPGTSVVDLAEQVGLSHTPCWRRLKKLEQAGAILERPVILNPEMLGLSVSVFAEVRLRQHDQRTLETFEESVRERPEIVECFSMSGETDYQLRVVVRDVAQYERFLKRVLLHLPGVGSVNSRFALARIKLTTCLPISAH